MSLVRYGNAYTFRRPLSLGADFLTTAPTITAGDVQISKDGAAYSNVASLPTFSNGQLVIVLSATEMQAAQVLVRWVDQTATKEWDDDATVIATYGNASAQHEVFPADAVQVSGSATAADNLELAGLAYTTTQGLAGTRLDAAISDVPTVAEIEAGLINDGDATALLQAIADKIASDFTVGDVSSAAIAAAVRVELATELARVDAAISSRLSTAGYTAPLDAVGTRASLGLASADLDTQLATLATQATIDLLLGMAAQGVASAASPGATTLTVTGLAQDASKYIGQYLVLGSGDGLSFASEIFAGSAGTSFIFRDALPAAVDAMSVVYIVGRAG